MQTTDMQTTSELEAKIIARANEDGEFRSRLLADPVSVFRGEYGFNIPDGYTRSMKKPVRQHIWCFPRAAGSPTPSWPPSPAAAPGTTSTTTAGTISRIGETSGAPGARVAGGSEADASARGDPGPRRQWGQDGPRFGCGPLSATCISDPYPRRREN